MRKNLASWTLYGGQSILNGYQVCCIMHRVVWETANVCTRRIVRKKGQQKLRSTGRYSSAVWGMIEESVGGVGESETGEESTSITHGVQNPWHARTHTRKERVGSVARERGDKWRMC
jgi:hypothetical protein